MKVNPGSDNGWLPTSIKELKAMGWDEPDVILFSGDAYIDHPSFGPAVIGRVIEDEGFQGSYRSAAELEG